MPKRPWDNAPKRLWENAGQMNTSALHDDGSREWVKDHTKQRELYLKDRMKPSGLETGCDPSHQGTDWAKPYQEKFALRKEAEKETTLSRLRGGRKINYALDGDDPNDKDWELALDEPMQQKKPPKRTSSSKQPLLTPQEQQQCYVKLTRYPSTASSSSSTSLGPIADQAQPSVSTLISQLNLGDGKKDFRKEGLLLSKQCKLDGSEAWECPECHKNFGKVNSLYSHMKSHSRIKCPDCNNTYSRNCHYLVHKTKHHPS